MAKSLKQRLIILSTLAMFLFPNQLFAQTRKSPQGLEKISYLSYFMNSLRKKVSEDGDLTLRDFPENRLLNDEEEEFSRLQKERLISLTASSARETFYQMPLGKEVERLEERISKYFIVGAFKEGNKVNFYLPGKVNSKGITKIRKIEEDKKGWGIRINRIIDSDLNFTPGIKGFYRMIEIKALYEPKKESGEISISFRF